MTDLCKQLGYIYKISESSYISLYGRAIWWYIKGYGSAWKGQ